MAMTDEVFPWYQKTTQGMNNKVEDLELGDKFVTKAQNCRFEEEPGAVRKRPPIAHYNSASLGTGAMYGLYRFYTSTGAIKSIAVHGSTVYVGDDDAGTWTSIRTLSNSNTMMVFETYRDLLIGSNGYDDIWVYDGSDDNVTWELGACKALTGAAGAITRTDISYQVTMDTDIYICGAVSNTIASVTAEDIELTNIPLGPAGTANRRIYRKSSETGGDYRLIATIANNVDTTYTDTTADASGGGVVPAATDDMPKGNILQIHRERLFISGDPSGNLNRIWYSDPFLPWFIQKDTNLRFMDVAKDDGDQIMGLAIHLGSMLCFKRNTIRKLWVASASSGADPDSWYAEDPLVHTGSPAQFSIHQTPYGIVFLGWDNWYMFDGAKVSQIIEEFDTDEILSALYSNVVAHWNKGLLFASYADTATATQYNNRVMVYSFTRDSWGFDTLNVNVFSTHNGDDETAELYYGDSVDGFVYKAEETDYWYKLDKKSECDNGTLINTYVGGTENNPYIEPGGSTAVDPIPENVCILWDSESETPGAGWTEITGDGKYLYISDGDAAGTETATSNHTHTASGSLAISTASYLNTGSGGAPNCELNNHTHSWSVTTGGESSEPKNTAYRVFRKNTDTTEYVFPIGAIVLWDTSQPSDGWVALDAQVGAYLKIGTTNLGIVNSPTHSHALSGSSSTYSGASRAAQTVPGTATVYGHNHTITGNTVATDTSAWDLDAVGLRLIKKIGEETTWDGQSRYVYCICYGEVTTNGWGSVTSTYDGSYVKVIEDAGPTTITADGAAHTHTIYAYSSGVNTSSVGNGGVASFGIIPHSHQVSGSATSGTSADPGYITFKFSRKILGQMIQFNDAITSNIPTGTWESPGLEIKAGTIGNIYFNASKAVGDTVTVFTKTGADQAAVEDATSCTAASGTDLFTAVGHGLSNDDRVVIGGTAVPTGIDVSRVYFVVGVVGNDFAVSLTSGGAAVDFSDNGTAVTFKKWDTAATASPTAIASTANVWIAYLIEFVSVDTTVSLSRVYLADSYLVKFSYIKKGTEAETAVEWIYELGWKNLDLPMLDKIHKKITAVYSSDSAVPGELSITWETETSGSTGTFIIDLSQNQKTFSSFYPSTAYGVELKVTFYKNDLNNFTLKEIKGVYTPRPLII